MKLKPLSVVANIILILVTGNFVAAKSPNHRHNPVLLPLEFASVATARKALQSQAGITSSAFEDWVFFDDAPRKVEWTFAPITHAAHPAVIRRAAVERNGRLVIEIGLLCEGAKDACGGVLKDFEKMKARRLELLRR